MVIQSWMTNSFQIALDCVYAALPQAIPSREILKKSKIVSHRGEHDNQTVWENTFPAFDTVCSKGVWGLELDIRWTKDLQPVVIHDPDCRRVFRKNIVVSQVSLNELNAQVPLIPTLEDTLEKYGQKMHLMVELKEEPYLDPYYQSQLLKNLFSSLLPEKDFHIISLKPAMFQFADFVPKSTLLPVAELNFRELSELALREQWGGLTGHYFFISNEMIEKHKVAHQKTGTGFVASRQSLFRELNRGVDWIFSNHAVKIQSLLQQLLEAH